MVGVQTFRASQINSDHHAMIGMAHGVMQLDIELGMQISIKDTCFRNVPDCSDLYNILNDKLLNGLVFGHTPVAMCITLLHR